MLKLKFVCELKWKNVFVPFTFFLGGRAYLRYMKQLSRTSPKRTKQHRTRKVNCSYNFFFKKLQAFGRGQGHSE